MKQLQQQPHSVTCYILWHIFHQYKKTDLAFSVDPLRYIFRFENKYTLFGEDVWQLEKYIRWFQTNIVLIFEKQRWEEIIHHFDNFRSLETNKPIDSYNIYLTLSLSREDLSFSEDADDRIIQIPSPEHPHPKRYRPLKGGLAFGLLKKDKIICFAAAPHILTQKSLSFAILRGIKTELLERRQGYALKTVGMLCKELFSRYQLSNIFLWVEETNTAARNLYEQLGFQEEAKIFSIYCDQKK